MTGGAATDQDLALRDRSVRDFYGRSTFHRERLERAGLGKHGLRHGSDLRKLAPMRLDDVDPARLLIDGRSPKNRNDRSRRQYWPLRWINAGGQPLAYSAEDLALLGDLGRDLLESYGLSSSDVLANVLPANGSRNQLQIELGCLTAGLSNCVFGTGAHVEQVLSTRPTVMVGEAREINRLFDATDVDAQLGLSTIHTFVVVGPVPQPRIWKKLLDNVGAIDKIVRAWSPAGVFGMWAQCRGGDGFHTWPDIEVVEVVDPLTGLTAPEGVAGNVLWTGLEWYATAILRLQTDAHASLVSGACPTCGRVTARLAMEQKAAGFPAVLDANDNVAKWFAELQRTKTNDELVIWIALRDPAHSLHVFADVDEKIGPARVQVVDIAEIERRREDAMGEKFGDRRAVSVV